MFDSVLVVSLLAKESVDMYLSAVYIWICGENGGK